MHLEDLILHNSLSEPVFIFGDFNLHHPLWGSNYASQHSEIFVEWLTNSNFILLNTDVPTQRSNVGSSGLLDFTLCSSSVIGYSNTFILDIFVYSSHQSLDIICPQLQNTLERINQWCNYWKLSLSSDKSTIAELSNKRIHSFPNILLAGTPLQWQSSIKYLGVYFSKRNKNINITHQMKNKAPKKVNALKGMAYKHYGLRAKNLVQLINNSICSTFLEVITSIGAICRRVNLNECHARECNAYSAFFVFIRTYIPLKRKGGTPPTLKPLVCPYQ
ncbi:RNase H domain-containing protein [Trichonephila clavipes]|nr:RNase H domain-containing protein [Trichonephila clavipes]